MNSTSEAWFAVAGFVSVPIWLYITVLLAMARFRRWAAGKVADPAEPAPEYPERRKHEPGGCWCGELHEGTPAGDGQPAWKAS